MAAPVLIYLYYANSYGHIRIAFRLAAALKREAKGTDVVVVNTGPPITAFQAPSGVELLQLPALVPAQGQFLGARPARLDLPLREVFALRRQLLCTLVDELRPSAVVTEFFPFGRSQLRPELLPWLAHLGRHHPRCRLISSTREIIGKPPPRDPAARRRQQRRINRQLATHFDQILIHGDPDFIPFDFPLTAANRAKVLFTGYLAEPAPHGRTAPAAASGKRVLVTAGGGMDGGRLMRAAIAAAQLLNRRRRRWQLHLVSGDYLADREQQRLAAAAARTRGVELSRFIADVPARLAASDLVVTMAGYNACVEALAHELPMVLVPRQHEPEQQIRARHLAARGLAEPLAPGRLTPARLAGAMERALAGPGGAERPRLDGLVTAARAILGVKRRGGAP